MNIMPIMSTNDYSNNNRVSRQPAFGIKVVLDNAARSLLERSGKLDIFEAARPLIKAIEGDQTAFFSDSWPSGRLSCLIKETERGIHVCYEHLLQSLKTPEDFVRITNGTLKCLDFQSCIGGRFRVLYFDVN